MSIIDRVQDPEAAAKKTITERLLLNPNFDESARLRAITQLHNQRIKLGLPLRDLPTDIDRLNTLHPAAARIAALGLQEQLGREVAKHGKERAEIVARLASMHALIDWIDADKCDLQRNDCSRLHKLKEAAKAKRIIGNDAQPLQGQNAPSHVEHTFVVTHDWRAAFEKAEGLSGDVRLPYEICAFEFRLSGRTVIALCIEMEGKPKFTSLAESGDYWYPLASYADEENDQKARKFAEFLWGHIRAMCIALDAEVATEIVVRAPHSLNEKRVKHGHVPVADYRVVELARRHRIANPTGATGTGVRKRLHFRRGHWRHFETTKTWVRWCLVGNPDLGFIQKHYSL